MAFLGTDGHITLLVGAASQIVFVLTIMSLLYNLLFKWNAIIDLLDTVALPESMYLNRSAAHTRQVKGLKN